MHHEACAEDEGEEDGEDDDQEDPKGGDGGRAVEVHTDEEADRVSRIE